MAHCFHHWLRLTSDLFGCLFLSLQRQVAGEVQTQPQDRAVNQIAMMLAIMGLSLSYYSAKQMTEKVHGQAQPAPWRDTVTQHADNGWANEKWRRWRKEAGSTPVSSWTALFSPHTEFLVSFTHHARTLQGCWEVFSVTFSCQDLEGLVGTAHSGGGGREGELGWGFWFWVGNQNQLSANWVWPSVITKVHACKMPSILFKTKRGQWTFSVFFFSSSLPLLKAWPNNVNSNAFLREGCMQLRCTLYWSDDRPRKWFKLKGMEI